MKRTGKALLLVLAAVLAVAFAVPAAASAAQWAQEGEPLQEPATITLNGNFGYYHGHGGYGCPIEAEVTLSPGDEGEIISFDADSANCQGSGLWAGCQSSAETLDLPVPVQATESGEIQITGFDYLWEFENYCYGGDLQVRGDLTATPNDTVAISELTLDGQVEWGPPGWLGTGEIIDQELAVTPEGGYGIVE